MIEKRANKVSAYEHGMPVVIQVLRVKYPDITRGRELRIA